MKIYDYILQDHNAILENAYDAINGLDWSEIETSNQDIKYKRFIDSVEGIDIYYDFGADYYFFSPVDTD